MISPGGALGELTVVEVSSAEPGLPLVRATAPDGRTLQARALDIGVDEPTARDALATFERRLATLASVSHPAVRAPLLWSVGPPPFAAWALEPGVLLTEHLAAPRDGDLAVAVGLEVANALAAVHEVGVVHGAVGPDAVLVAEDGRVLLGDFGIRELAARLAQHATSLLPAVVGSFAPEHARGGAEATPASDVFALGVTLYRIVTGRSPFEGPSPLAVTLKLSMGSYEPIPPSAAVQEPLRALVHQMLEREPERRPTAVAVARELALLALDEEARRALFRAASPPAPMPVRTVLGVGFGDDVATEIATSTPEHVAVADETAPPSWIGGRGGQGFDAAPTEFAPPPPADFELLPDAPAAPDRPEPRRRPVRPRPSVHPTSGPTPLVLVAIGVGALTLMGLVLGLILVVAS